MLRLVAMLLISCAMFTAAQAAQYRPLKNDAEKNAKTKKMLYGKVAAISPAQIVIENEAGAKKAIPLDGKTKFRTDRNKGLKITDLKAGASVRVLYRVTDGKAILVQEYQAKQFTPEN